MTHSDGRVEVFPTNWDQMRRDFELEQQRKRVENRSTAQAHQAEKREAASKKRSGRGC